MSFYLLQEGIEENKVEVITESTESGKQLYITGPFLQADVKNRNGRIYPLDIMKNAVRLYEEHNIKMNKAYGELDHPEGPKINLDRVSHMVKELTLSGSTYYGKALVTEGTPCGKIVAGLLRAGANLGVSSRGLGSVRESNGVNYVQEDFRLTTAADVVTDPSAPDAYVQSLMEGEEWVWNNGVWEPKRLEISKKLIEKASTRELQEAKLKAFTDAIKNI